MTHSLELVVLAYTKVGENALVLHTLTSEWGRRSFICSIPHSSGISRFMPLSILNAEIVENTRSDLWRAHKFFSVHPLNSLRGNLYKNTITMFISEVLYRTIKDGANEEGLYDWCKKSILTLDALTDDFSNFHLRFLLELTGVLGFSPTEKDLLPFSGEHSKELASLLKLDFGEFMLFPLNGPARNDIAEILLQYLSFHTESAINVQSLAVLREIYSHI